MIVVHKFVLNGYGVTKVRVSNNCSFLKIDTQNDQPVVWIQTDTDAPYITEDVHASFTGTPMDKDMVENSMYIGTTTVTGRVVHFYVSFVTS